jgi:hypothetical protein
MMYAICLVSQAKPSLDHIPDPINNASFRDPAAGTCRAHANPRVVEHISFIIKMLDYRHQFLELNMCERLSVADASVLVHRLGLTKAANFISVVDPWIYPHDDTPASLNHKSYVQSVVAQAAHAGKNIDQIHTRKHIRLPSFSAPR